MLCLVTDVVVLVVAIAAVEVIVFVSVVDVVVMDVVIGRKLLRTCPEQLFAASHWVPWRVLHYQLHTAALVTRDTISYE